MSLEAYPLVRDWLRVDGGQIVLRSGKVDIGQRISTALTRIVAEELALDPEEIGVAEVRAGAVPDEGVTSGSNSIEQSGGALRLAAATLREAARALASQRLGEASPELRDGLFVTPNRNRSLTLIELAEALDPELAVDVAASLRRADPPPIRTPRGLREMVTGTFEFLHDIDLPGMLHARIVRPPHRKARLASLDESGIAALEAEGIAVHRDGSFLAVAGAREYAVQRAAERLALACVWEGALDEGDIFAILAERERISLPLEDVTPVEKPVPSGLEGAQVEGVYERPYQMHGSLAPSAALVEFDGRRLSVLSHSQGIHSLRESMAEALGMEIEDIGIAYRPGSGCYGHSGGDDAAFEAALIARAMPRRPILLKWTRRDEHRWEPLAPAMRVEVAARLEAGQIAAWSQEAAGGTHRGRPRPGPERAGPRRFAAAPLLAEPEEPFVPGPNMGRHAGLHRNIDPVYAIPERRLVKHLIPEQPLYTSALRCLGAVTNVFAIECAMDELAAQAGVEPLAFRLAHLQEARARAVLLRLDEMARATPKGEGEGRGFAYAQYKNAMTRVGAMVDLTMSESGAVRLRRAVLVADAGRVIDPDGLRSQIEGGFIQAASWSLFEQVRWDRDGVSSEDWDSYPVIRFGDVPEIEVEMLHDPEARALGAGEAACGPAVAAIANAIADTSGLRLRRLPFTEEAVRAAALAG